MYYKEVFRMVSNYLLTNEQRTALNTRLTKANLERVKTGAVLIILIELFMVVRNIYMFQFMPNPYIFLYSSLIFLSIALLLGIKYMEEVSRSEKKYIYLDRMMIAYCVLILTWGVLVTFVDQAGYGNITAYISKVMIVMVLFITNMKLFIQIQLFPLLFFCIGLYNFQPNPVMYSGHLINFAIFFVFIILGAKVTYSKYKRLFIQEIELQKKNKELAKLTKYFEQLSIIDDLTQIQNRRGMYEYVYKKCEMPESNIGILVIDVDAFKRYNDHYGHLKGNEVLIQIAGHLQMMLNEKGHYVARFGGEEFVAIVNDLTEKEVFDLAEELRIAIEELAIEHSASSISEVVTISIGCCKGTVKTVDDFELILDRADRALYDAKRTNRNCVKCYTQMLKERIHIH